MNFLPLDIVHGDVIQMRRTDPRHLDLSGRLPQLKPLTNGTGFGKILEDTLRGVNDLQQQSTALSQQMLVDPDSVDAHDVTIAMAKASTALSLAKAIIDRALKAYNEIINVR
ncbi:MAG: flagellar hook-basal body complex protein FliE [Spirochaetota bacterium]